MHVSRMVRQALIVFVLVVAGTASAQAAPPGGIVLQGVLTWLVGDPNPAIGGQSKRFYILNVDGGGRFELDVAGPGISAGELNALLGTRVQALVEAPEKSASGEAPRLRVRELQALQSKQAKITGSQPFVSILCRFAGNAAQPRPPAYFATQLGTTAPGFNHYYREASYDTLNLDGSAVSSAWVDLPQPRSFYIDGVKPSSTYLDELFDACTAAADSIVNFSQFYGVNLMFNDAIDDAAWGGATFRTLDGVEKAWPTTWMPYFGEEDPFGWRNHGVLAHEMSHAFGAPHSESPDGDEYGSQWDVVSSPGATCATVDANYGCLGQSVNAYGKAAMEILPANRQATHAGGTLPYTIERLAQPPTPGSTVMVRVPIAGTTTRFYTVESRFRVGYDAQLPGDGVIIHVVDTTKDRPARIVSPAGSGVGLGGIQSIWPVGGNFISMADNVSIRVDAFSPDGTATVTVGPAASAPQPAVRGDVNGDRKADLHWREVAPGVGLSWWTMDGNASTGTNYHQLGIEWQIADVGDLDGDGKADLIWRRASDGANYLWTLDGLGFKGFFDLGILSPAQWALTGSADLDGDGKGDVVWRGTDGTVYGWLMNGGAIASQGAIGNPGVQWVIADLADMNGDGKADIVFRNTTDGGIYVFFMNGLAVASGGFVGTVDPVAWTLIGAADFSGDGKADFLWRHTSGDTWVWLMDGAAFQSAGGIGNPGAGWSVRSFGDFDGDGKADLVWRHTDGTTYFWKMNGASVTSYLPVPNPGGTWQIVAP